MAFNHNDHYHRYLLRRVPSGCRRALDVGCGAGGFARALAERSAEVDAVDRSAEMLDVARAGAPPNVRFIEADVLTHDFGPARYDYVSAIASLHHLPLTEAVSTLRALLAPGGVLAVLGLSRPTLTDLAVAAVGMPGELVRRRLNRNSPAAPEPPIRDADHTLAEIRAEARRLLPGAVIRRHLYWRYSLVYRAGG